MSPSFLQTEAHRIRSHNHEFSGQENQIIKVHGILFQQFLSIQGQYLMCNLFDPSGCLNLRFLIVVVGCCR
eukprot:scaffold67762_cov49-Attheya_sp.AAC.4